MSIGKFVPPITFDISDNSTYTELSYTEFTVHTRVRFLLFHYLSVSFNTEVLILSNLQGAAFGFGSIAAQAGEQLAPFLHQIVPKLYRYQFDPNPKIQQAMASIWHAVVPDAKRTV